MIIVFNCHRPLNGHAFFHACAVQPLTFFSPPISPSECSSLYSGQLEWSRGLVELILGVITAREFDKLRTEVELPFPSPFWDCEETAWFDLSSTSYWSAKTLNRLWQGSWAHWARLLPQEGAALRRFIHLAIETCIRESRLHFWQVEIEKKNIY